VSAPSALRFFWRRSTPTLAMTKNRIALAVVVVIAAAYGATAVAVGIFWGDLTMPYRASAVASGLLLIGGAWLTWRGRFSGVVFLWASALLYILMQVVPAMQRHGNQAFSMLMNAFYVSVAIRVSLAAAGHYLLKARHG
jgi:hypothetical protein